MYETGIAFSTLIPSSQHPPDLVEPSEQTHRRPAALVIKRPPQKSRINRTIFAITMVLTIGLLSGFIACARAQTIKENDTSKSAIELRKVDIFAIGYIGFVGHISPGQKLYEEILKSKSAEPTFLEIIDASDSSVASKLYSLCGLKKLSSPEYKRSKEKILSTHEIVSTMTVDIMRKEDISDLVRRIDNSGC